MSKKNNIIDSNLNEYLQTFFAYNKDSRHNERKYNRPFKWEQIKEDLNLINSLDPNLVLDLGCGDNRYKPIVKNLIGIDVVDKPNVDIVSDFTSLDYSNQSVDAIIAYGSINFGDDSLITKQLLECYRVLKKQGIICFRAYSSEESHYYNWTENNCNFYTEKFNFKLLKPITTVYRLNQKGLVNKKWRDNRYEKLHNDESKRRALTRLHWVWQKVEE